MLIDRFTGLLGKFISCLLIVTTQAMTAHLVYAQDEMSNAIREANALGGQLLGGVSTPKYDSDGNLMHNGKVLFDSKAITGQRDNDKVLGSTDVFGSDSKTLEQGEAALKSLRESKDKKNKSSAEHAFEIMQESYRREKPDLTNDPIWDTTDKILGNVEEIAKEFANCKLSKELVNIGKSYRVPKYETCERLPAIEDSFTISHSYEVGVLKHESGPYNIAECGRGCFRVWVGTLDDNYWRGKCLFVEEQVVLKVIRPSAITKAELEYAQFDDYFQVLLDGAKVYVGPENVFPKNLIGIGCERGVSWNKYPNIDVTSSFTSKAINDLVEIKNQILIGGGGEGHSRLRVFYDPKKSIWNEHWNSQELIAKAFKVKTQIEDGYCKGEIKCTSGVATDANGCAIINGLKVCESDFDNPLSGLGISPFCKRVEVTSNCSFNEGRTCWKDMNGKEQCFDNKTVNRNLCKKYEENSQCSFVKSSCVDGAVGKSGECYVQEDTFDCGFTVSTGETAEEEVIKCDGKLKCVGESCYSPARDKHNDSFGQASAYLEMLKHAKADMRCEGVPDKPYDPKLPPDQYIPVPSCDDGFVYDKDTKQCLQKIACKYSNDDFYASSIRNGIQVVTGGDVKADNGNVPTCIPVTVGGVTYSCGEARKRAATDTFYEVCTNKVKAPKPKGCPSRGHIVNPKNGFCEIPPIPKCPEGYDLIEGSKPFDMSDDTCETKRFPVDKTCKDGFTLKGDTCERVLTASPRPFCPSGYSTNGWTCNKTVTSNPNYTCPAGTSITGRQCTKKVYDCRYSTSGGNDNNFWMELWGGGYYAQWDGTWILDVDYNKLFKRGKYGTSNESGRLYEICRASQTTVPRVPVCPSGSRLQSGKCEKRLTSNATPVCDSGYKLQGGQCKKVDKTTYIPVCTSGYTLSDDKKSCIKKPPTVKPKAGCPSQYPNWNAREGRCTTKPFELPKPKSASAFSVLNSNYDAIATSAEIKDYEDSEPTTKKSILSYLQEQMMEEVEYSIRNQDALKVGRQQLASFGAAHLGYSASAFSPDGGGSNGSKNVTCQLFKGKAQYCKVAVGGMKDCCEAPVLPSLADYIQLTNKTLMFNSMTGAVEVLDAYGGIFDLAVEGGKAAYNAVSSLWVSAGETAAQEAAKTAGTEAGKGVMAGFVNQMMIQFNVFLTNTFGPEVAKLFFQSAAESVASAGAGAATGSAAMQAVGTAMAVIGYAYMAYVIFNLLVNIVYACEEEELDVAMKKEMLSTHYLGSYCAQKVLGACIEKRNVYCSFDSPLSRIIMEQIYAQPQMKLNWGTPKNPTCDGLALTEMHKVDWKKVNLDEWTAILIKTGNVKMKDKVNIESLTGKGSLLNNGERKNVKDVNMKRAEGLDGDKLKRDAYEEARKKVKP